MVNMGPIISTAWKPGWPCGRLLVTWRTARQ